MSRLIKVLIGVVIVVLLKESLAVAQSTNKVTFTYDQMGNLTGIVDMNAMPQAPLILGAWAGSTAIILLWDDKSDNESGFIIERKLSGGSFTEIARVATNSESYLDTGLTPSTDYYYQVRAIGGAGNSPPSNMVEQMTLASPPAAPTDLGGWVGSVSVVICWTINSTGEAGFFIERKLGIGGSYALHAQVGPGVRCYCDTNLAPGATYYYRVRALRSNVYSEYSNELGLITSGTPPAAPTNLVAYAGSSIILLLWKDTSDNESIFSIERKTQGGTYTPIGQVGMSVQSYIDTDIAPDTIYYYQVRAFAGLVYSQYSNETHVTSPPATPSGLVATASSSSVIELRWTDTATSETGFVIERKTFEGGTYTQVGQVGANTSYYLDSGLLPDTTYYYRVRAIAGAASSPFSNEASATTKAPAPAAPSNLTATAVYASQINLSWINHSSNAVGFTIERKTGTSGSWVPIVMLGANSIMYADTGIAASTTYTYRVTANGLFGDSVPSNDASATTSQSRDPSAPVLTVESYGIGLTLIGSVNDFFVERKLGATEPFLEIAQAMGSNYTDPVVQPGVTYYYRVRTYDATSHAYSTYSNEASAVQSTAVVPSGLTVTANGMNLILTWTDNTNDESGFQVERKAGEAGTWAEIGIQGSNNTTTPNQVLYEDSSIDSRVNPGVTYYYRVRAYIYADGHEIGHTGYSTEAHGALPTTLAPSGLTVTADGMRLKLTWIDNTTDELTFDVERKYSTRDFEWIGGGGGSNTTTPSQASYTDPEVQPGVTYTYRVDARGWGTAYTGYSNEASGSQATTVAPSGLTVTAVGTSLQLTWTDKTTNEDGFKVERRVGETGPWTEIGTVAGFNTITPSQATYADSTTSSGVKYYYRVRAYTLYGGNTDYSNEASGTP